jgi:hypothetical protein
VTSGNGHHLAQVNIGRLQAPLDSAQLSGFVVALEPINALADVSPGFVWRLQTEDGDATAVRPYDDDMVLINMSVWESLEDLRQFVYRSVHSDVMHQRRQWFSRMDTYLALWWIPAGTIPSVADAARRLAVLASHGPTPEAFTFRVWYRPPGAAPGAAADDEADDRYRCTAP